jgi:cysteine synthase A
MMIHGGGRGTRRYSGITKNFSAVVGNTPLIELFSLSKLTGCRILGKAEFMNPGGSVKDRAALFIINHAERDGFLKQGERGIIVEGTAGNTGIGLTLVGNERGYRTVIVMPNNQAREKIELLQTLGADVRLVAPAPFSNQENYYHVARELAQNTKGAFWANQFENTANFDSHFAGTGAEIWEQTQGAIDIFVTSAGTGGTIGGVSAQLALKNPKLQSYLIDPKGSGLFNYIATGEFKAEGSSITEGIGINRLTQNFAQAKLTGAIQGSDQEAVDICHYLAKHEGIFIGSSAGLNVVGALKLAKKSAAGKTIVTILCDGGGRYQSKLYNPSWLAEQKLTPRVVDRDWYGNL